MSTPTLTHAEVESRLAKIDPNIIMLGSYCNSKVPIRCKCLSCKLLWSPTWNSLQSGHGCPKCSQVEGHRKTSSKPRFSSALIKEKMAKINSNVKMLGEYIKSDTPIRCRCMRCQHVWSPIWDNLKQGKGCPKCAGKLQDTASIKRTLRSISPSIKLEEEYSKSDVPIKCSCRECGYMWSPIWDNLKQGQGCPQCSNVAKLDISVVKERLRTINPNIRIVGKYKSGKPIACKCKGCGRRWRAGWDSLQAGHGCPHCTAHLREEEARKTLEKLTGWRFPKANPSEVPWLHGLHLDGYNRKHGIAFELQGRQHYELVDFGGKKDTLGELHKRKRNDARKRVQCWRHGVKLIVIPYYIKDLYVYLSKRSLPPQPR